MHSDFDKRCILDIKNKTGVDLQTAYQYYDLNNHDYEKTLAALKDKCNPAKIRENKLKENAPKEKLPLDDHDKEIIKDISMKTGASLKEVLIHYNRNHHDCEKTFESLKQEYDFSGDDKKYIEELQRETGVNRRTVISYYLKNGHDYEKALADLKSKHGPALDRAVDGIKSQSKYCSSGSKCISKYFKDGKFRYMDGNFPMQIEVPSDKYDAAVEAMENRIRKGQVPEVSDPKGLKTLCKEAMSYTLKRTIKRTIFQSLKKVIFKI